MISALGNGLKYSAHAAAHSQVTCEISPASLKLGDVLSFNEYTRLENGMIPVLSVQSESNSSKAV